MSPSPYAAPIPETMQLVGRPPETLEETGVPENLLEDLALKTIYPAGELSLGELARRMHLHTAVIYEIFEHLRKAQVVEVVGMTAGTHRVALTSKGQAEVRTIMLRDMYAGPAPVSLAAYVKMVRAQSVANTAINRPDLYQAYENLVISPRLLDKLGTALVSGQSIILYGPAGTGKTLIAETLPRIYKDSVWIPHAIEVQGQIIAVFDPMVHTSREEMMPPECDTRWNLCRRPRVMVGGELTMHLLDVQLRSGLGFYSAPLQMKANNGIFIVDDFGRQRISPAELLNRWIVPLERRLDFLTLASGNKIQVPFDVIVAFSTNLNPASLADEAFMRRIQTKVRIDYATEEEFHEISRRVCAQFGLEYDAAVVNGFIKVLAELRQPLRACFPRDIVQQICWKAKYEMQQPEFTVEVIRAACNSYFLAPEADLPSA